MRRSILLAIACSVATAGPTADGLAAQTPECPPGTYTVEMLQQRILELSAVEGGAARISPLVSRSLARRSAPGCTFLRDDIDRQAAMERLIDFIVREDAPGIEGIVFQGIRMALLNPGDAELRIPVGAAGAAVEEFGSGAASYFLRQFADDPAVREYLLGWARAAVGPPGRPDWPAEIVEVLVHFPSPHEDALRAELHAAPQLIQNPRARCLAERRSREDPPCPDPGPP